MNEQYRKHVAEREALGIPPLPLSAEQVEELTKLLVNPPHRAEQELLDLLSERIAPGVGAPAKAKADFLAKIAKGEISSPVLTQQDAIGLLGTMLGGYNVPYLVSFLDDEKLASSAVKALKHIILIGSYFDDVKAKMASGNPFARDVMESWASAEWFTSQPPMPDEMQFIVYKVSGEVNTDDLSPASQAITRPDIPLHALSMGQKRFPNGVRDISFQRLLGNNVVFVADILGTGSSRKSATNSLMWHIGNDIPHVPNKRRGGVVIAKKIAPIFFSTFEDSGGLPIQADVTHLSTGQTIIIEPHTGQIKNKIGDILAQFELHPATISDEYRAGGRLNLLIGRKLTAAAQEALNKPKTSIFISTPSPEKHAKGYTLAQKIVGRACGKDGVLPHEKCEPRISTVGSQDTTGPMTADEMMEFACLNFDANMVMQSFCHTAAYPTEKDKAMHFSLWKFFTERGGLALKPGDGIIHSWLNRLILPDEVGTGGDSHTRFPLGISFPAGSGLVAFAATFGFMPLDMPESVLVSFRGELRTGITLRDVVNAIPLIAMKQGLLTLDGTTNIFAGRIMEFEGISGINPEQAFELTCASAERSAAAATIALDEESIAKYLHSNVALMKSLIADGYESSKAIEKRISAIESWLGNPEILKRDESAEFAEKIEIDLHVINEPIVACPNHPDNVKTLSEIAGVKIDEVFIGSCMTNIGHFRAASHILKSAEHIGVKRLWIVPPTRMDRKKLEDEGAMKIFEHLGASIEIPGCSLCMGNQARVADGAVVFSTSTRNFDDRMGSGAQVYLGSAELAAVVAVLGRIPTTEEYFHYYEKGIERHRDTIYKMLDFSEIYKK